MSAVSSAPRGLAKEVVVRIYIGERRTFVEVSGESATFILKKLNGIKFKGHKLAVTVAR